MTVLVYTVEGLQLLPVLLNVNEYVLVTVGVAVALCIVDEKPFGPVHAHEVALLEFAFNVAVLPMHIGLLVAPVDDGTRFTVTLVVYIVKGLQPEVPLVLVTVKE